jgi:2',3'-cyclic-nucleotide 2'-phosphodiesterase (5'-nucleotidase family)
LDTGDALTVEGNPESLTMGEEIVAGMNLMGYDAMAIGPVDLQLGAAALRQRLSEADFPMLSANVLWSGDRGYVGDPYTILQAGSYRIGVIGLTRLPDGELPDYEFLGPEGVLAELVPEVGEQVDIVVLLTNLRYRATLELAKAVPGIDLVVAALPRQLPDHAVRAAHTGTLVVTAEQPLPLHTGRRVGKLTVKVDSDGTLRSEVWASTPMGPEFADDSHMKELLDEYQ